MSVHNDFYSCYYNHNPEKLIRTDLHDNWRVYFSHAATRPIRSFKEEVLLSCDLIYESLREYTPKLNFFFSGGIDSESVLRCFHERKIPINPVIIRHKHYPNSDEMIIARQVCLELNLTPQIIDIDFFELFKNDTLHLLGEKYQTSHLAIIELMHAFEIIGEPSIIVDDVQLFKGSINDNLISNSETENQVWYYELKEDVDGPFDRFEAMHGYPVIADALKYTPESWIAMLTNSTISSIVKPGSGKASSVSSKNIMMSREFKVFWRQKTSIFTDGFYKHINNVIQRELEYKLFPVIRPKIEYAELLRTLGYKNEI